MTHTSGGDPAKCSFKIYFKDGIYLKNHQFTNQWLLSKFNLLETQMVGFSFLFKFLFNFSCNR
uniref:Uncharacterized protein n=1 Tax=Tetranychus urticae TaxID=32264 RepID=T1K5P0_TETUR